MNATRRYVAFWFAAAVAAGAAGLAGCTSHALNGADGAAANTVTGVGVLPGSGGQGTLSPVPVSVARPYSGETPVGSLILGNHVLLIGDSIFASISPRYGNQACEALVPNGWKVEVDAETGRFIEFGAKVLDKRLAAGWDAAVVLLGNNYRSDKARYQNELHMLLARLAPRPTVLLTTTVFRPEQLVVNYVILAEAKMFPNVTVLDWAAITNNGSLTGADNLHLTEPGRKALGVSISLVLGHPPASAGAGQCLTSSFKDDSAGSPTGNNGSTNTVPNKSTTTVPETTEKPSAGAPSSTAKPVTTTTTAQGDAQNEQDGVDEQGAANDVATAATDVQAEADNESADDESGDQQDANDQSEEQGDNNDSDD